MAGWCGASHADALVHLSHALFHLLPRRCAADPIVVAPCMAAAVSVGGMYRGLLYAGSVRRRGGPGGYGLHSRSRGDGRRRHRRNAGREYRDHGRLQPAVQRGGGFRRAVRAARVRQRRVHRVADPAKGRAAARRAVRGGTAVQGVSAACERLGVRPQPDIVLRMAHVAYRHHRTYDMLPARPRRSRPHRGAGSGGRFARHMPAAIRHRPQNRPPLRRYRRGRPVPGAEEHCAGGLDVAIIPRPHLFRRSYGIYRLAELRK